MGWKQLSTLRTINNNRGQDCLLVAGMADDPDELVERLTAYYGLPTNPMDCGGSAINALERDIAVGEMILRAVTNRTTWDDEVYVYDADVYHKAVGNWEYYWISNLSMDDFDRTTPVGTCAKGELTAMLEELFSEKEVPDGLLLEVAGDIVTAYKAERDG